MLTMPSLPNMRQVERILSARTFTKQTPGAGGIHSAAIAFDGTDIDQTNMSVVIPFADGNRRDGVGDVVEVLGIDVERHRDNPLALFDHGKTITLPIGGCEDKQGNYTVVRDGDKRKAYANVFFYQGPCELGGLDQCQKDEHSLFCEQLFHLIVARIIRAGSFGYLVLDAKPLREDPQSGKPKGLHLLATELLELGPVVLPANGDAVRKCLEDGACGKPLAIPLYKSLEPYAAEAMVMVNGYGEKAAGMTRIEGEWIVETFEDMETRDRRLRELQSKLAFPQGGAISMGDQPKPYVKYPDSVVTRSKEVPVKADKERNLSTTDIPPADWKPGQGAKENVGEARPQPSAKKSCHCDNCEKGLECCGKQEKSQSSIQRLLDLKQGHPKDWNQGEIDNLVNDLSGKEAQEVWEKIGMVGSTTRDKLKRVYTDRMGAWQRTELMDRKQLPSEEADVSPEKAREILSDGTVHGKPLTEAQRGMFGAIAGRDRKAIQGLREKYQKKGKKTMKGKKKGLDGKVKAIRIGWVGRPELGEVNADPSPGENLAGNDVHKVRYLGREFPVTWSSEGRYVWVKPEPNPSKSISNRNGDHSMATKKGDKGMVRRIKAAPEGVPDDADMPEYETKDHEEMGVTDPPMDTDEKLGAQVLRRIYQDQEDMLADYDQLQSLLEEEGVTAFVQEKLEAITESMSAAEGLFSEKYPDYPPLGGGGEMEAEVEAPEEELEPEEPEEKAENPEEIEETSDEPVPPEEVTEGMQTKAIKKQEKAMQTKSTKLLRSKYGKKDAEVENKEDKKEDKEKKDEKAIEPPPDEPVEGKSKQMGEEELGNLAEVAKFLKQMSLDPGIGEDARQKAGNWYKTVEEMAAVPEQKVEEPKAEATPDTVPVEGEGLKGIPEQEIYMAGLQAKALEQENDIEELKAQLAQLAKVLP